VWTFGQQVNDLVPMAHVNDAWRAMAVKKIPHIEFRGPVTDIRAALEKPSRTKGINKPIPT